MKTKTKNILIIAVIMSGLIAGDVLADDTLRLTLSPLDGSSSRIIYIKQISNAKEPGQLDFVDIPWDENTGVRFYLENIDGRWQTECRPTNSVTDLTAKIEGENISLQVYAYLDLYFSNSQGAGSFDWKNVIVKLYDEKSGSPVLIGTYDAHDISDGTINIPRLTIKNELSYSIAFKPRNYADLDFDRDVLMSDFAKLAGYWLAQGASASNVWKEYADIDRNGVVGLGDVAILSEEWFWSGS